MFGDDFLQALAHQVDPPDTGEPTVVVEVQHWPGRAPGRVDQAPAAGILVHHPVVGVAVAGKVRVIDQQAGVVVVQVATDLRLGKTLAVGLGRVQLR
ncbi:hypothetical protein D9M73_189310 [compost metagenome]